MSMASKAKRLTYLVHRWTGVAGCVLMLLWFISGVVMLYVGYPKLTPWERLAALPQLDPQSCCVSLEDVVGDESRHPDASLVLTSIRNEPAYLLRRGQGEHRVFSALTGAEHDALISVGQAVQAAQAFASDPSARYEGQVYEDRWTHSRGLDVHRPLHKVQVHAPKPSTLYVSSKTGQVVLDAPLAQQRWNYVGAWLHWLYVFRGKSVDPVWSWIVIALSAAGTVSAISGVCVGIWRWRFRSRYKSGSRSPYREPWMKWHHIAGLLFSGFVCTWIFSGLMSMNPAGIFSPKHGKPDLQAYRGSEPPAYGGLAQPARVIDALRSDGFRPVELAWHRLAGRAYVLAYDAQAETRIVKAEGGGLIVGRNWAPAELESAAKRLFSAPILRRSTLLDYDAYYYQRHPEAMNGGAQLGLPALRLQFADPGRTRVYIDLKTGEVELSLSRSQRTGRWLFYFLHSWDTPGLLRAATLRELVLILLSAGGAVVAAAGMVIGWRRVRASVRLRARDTR